MRMVQFHHISLNCRDVSRLEEFYSRHFDLRRARVIDLPDGRRVVFLKGGNGVYLELFPAEGERPAALDVGVEGPVYPGVRNFSFEVDSLEEQVAVMKDDAHVAYGPASFDEYVPGWRSLWLSDPEGNVFQITQGFGH